MTIFLKEMEVSAIDDKFDELEKRVRDLKRKKEELNKFEIRTKFWPMPKEELALR